MNTNPLISVAIATYNGSRFLEEQLHSIYNQTYKNIEVIVSDDQSNDATIEILKNYQQHYGLRYYINTSKQGVIKNFEKAISYASGEYIALADQDDVWMPDKLALSIEKLRLLEKNRSSDLPALVFSDLIVVNEQLETINESYWLYMQLNPRKIQLNKILVENVMTGCTMLMNRATVNLSLPIPDKVLMHDVWFLMVASCFGSVSHITNRTVLYRQHNLNVVGASRKSFLKKISSGYNRISRGKFSLLDPEIDQAKAFFKRFQDNLSTNSKNRSIIESFIKLKATHPINRKYLILKYGFYGNTLGRALNVLFRA